MKRFLLITLFAVSSVGLAQAQQATGPAAERDKEQLSKMEQEKVQALLSTTSGNNYSADWFNRVATDGIALQNSDGSLSTKAQLLTELRSEDRKVYYLNQHDQHVHVFGKEGNGTLGVVNYIDDRIVELKGRLSHDSDTIADVYVMEDGLWRMVSHSEIPLHRNIKAMLPTQ